MPETLADRIKDIAREVRWLGGDDNDPARVAIFNTLYGIGGELAGLQAENARLRDEVARRGQALRPFARVGELVKPLELIAATDTYLWKQDSTIPTDSFGITLADCIEAGRAMENQT